VGVPPFIPTHGYLPAAMLRQLSRSIMHLSNDVTIIARICYDQLADRAVNEMLYFMLELVEN